MSYVKRAYETKAHELSQKYARQYKHNNCDLTDNNEFVFSNKEIEDACVELGRGMYWKARKAFCKTTCGDVCPLLAHDIEGGGGLVAVCDKIKTFVKVLETI